jgi:hypothetical protein
VLDTDFTGITPCHGIIDRDDASKMVVEVIASITVGINQNDRSNSV